jgi:serine/threonine protein kinase
MAPEQAKGRPVSKASDIWAFGCVLYEMLTGRAVFAGDDVTEVLAAVVRADPDWSALPGSTPREVRMVLRHCLHKDQRRRWQDAASLRIGIDDAVNAPVDLAAEAPVVRTKANRQVAVGQTLQTVTAARTATARPVSPATTRPLFGIRSSDYPPGAFPIRAYDVTRDGRRFLMTQEDEDSAEPPITQVVIVQHWLEELKRMTPAK